jgi:hypothetical protein
VPYARLIILLSSEAIETKTRERRARQLHDPDADLDAAPVGASTKPKAGPRATLPVAIRSAHAAPPVTPPFATAQGASVPGMNPTALSASAKRGAASLEADGRRDGRRGQRNRGQLTADDFLTDGSGGAADGFENVIFELVSCSPRPKFVLADRTRRHTKPKCSGRARPASLCSVFPFSGSRPRSEMNVVAVFLILIFPPFAPYAPHERSRSPNTKIRRHRLVPLPPVEPPPIPATVQLDLDNFKASVEAVQARELPADLAGFLESDAFFVDAGERFAAFDVNRSGLLEPPEVARLVADIFGYQDPVTNEAVASAFAAVIDPDPKQRSTISHTAFSALCRIQTIQVTRFFFFSVFIRPRVKLVEFIS